MCVLKFIELNYLLLLRAAHSTEEKQQILSSAIIPVFLLGILTAHCEVGIVTC